MLNKINYHLSRGKDWYNTYKKNVYFASNVKIKNTKLAWELEKECEKRNGVLTYAEYLTLDQFGQNGFYTTNLLHGKTNVEKRWGGALAHYCQQMGHDTIIEFGCGTGELGIATVKAYKHLMKRKLSWNGVEIDKQIHTKIINNFRAQNLQDSLEKIAATIDELLPKEKALIVFPYSLDNIPPHVFLNTKNYDSYPNAILGITVKKGLLSEVIIPAEILNKKGISLENGLFTQDKFIFKLTGWKLRKGQRAYIPVDSYKTIYTYAKKFDKATILIIDEFRKEPWFFNLENRGVPKSLYEKNLLTNERNRYYREGGEHNLYYPLYKDSLLKFLTAIGFRSIEYEIEPKKAAELQKKPWFAIAKNYTTFAFFAKDFAEKKNNIIPIPFNPQKIM
jgi:hypothetical protein